MSRQENQLTLANIVTILLNEKPFDTDKFWPSTGCLETCMVAFFSTSPCCCFSFFVFLQLFTLPGPGVLSDIAWAFCVPPPTSEQSKNNKYFLTLTKFYRRNAWRD